MRLALLTTDSREYSREYNNPNPYFGSAPAALLEGFSRLSGFEVHVISCAQKHMSSPKKIASNIWFHSLYVPKIGWLRTGYSGCIFAVRNKLKEIQPDIVHGQGTERDCGISSVFSGYPNIITIHGNMAELARVFHSNFGSFHWWAAKLENFTLPRTFGVFCNSAHTYSLVSSRAKRTWRVPNALRTAFFYRPEIIRAPASQITFLVVGVVTPNKRQVELLALFIRLRQYYTCFQVKFVGSCGDNPYSRAFLEKLTGESQSTWATWLGVLDESSLMHCMDESQVLVHFPLEESFGLVVAEALARGLKLFASKVGGIRDIASGVPEAELFDPEDWEGLQDSLLRWIQNPTPSSTQTQQLMRMRYDPKTIASRHLEIYREVLSASNPS